MLLKLKRNLIYIYITLFKVSTLIKIMSEGKKRSWGWIGVAFSVLLQPKLGWE